MDRYSELEKKYHQKDKEEILRWTVLKMIKKFLNQKMGFNDIMLVMKVKKNENGEFILTNE